MANIKQQKKRVLTNERQRLDNASFVSSMKTSVKKVERAVSNNDKKTAETQLKEAFMKLDKASSKGIIHKKNCANHKSRLQQLVNNLK